MVGGGGGDVWGKGVRGAMQTMGEVKCRHCQEGQGP